MNNKISRSRQRALARVASMMALTASLAACDNGASTPPPPVPAPPAPAVAAKVALVSPSDGGFAWRTQQALSLTLTTSAGAVVAASGTTCVSHDPTLLTVSADCTQVTALRVGSATIDVSGGGATASILVRGVPQRQWTGVHGESRNTALVVSGDGNAFAWGDNTDSVPLQGVDLRTLAFLGSAMPMKGALSLPINAASQVSAGEETGALLAVDGTAYAWGDNGFNELGAGSTSSSSVTELPIVDLTAHANLNHVAQLEIGKQNGVALIDDGSVISWGSFTGSGGTSNVSLPVQVLGLGGTAPLAHVSAISAGYDYTLALTDDGHVLSWGLDSSVGVLGANTTFNGVELVPGYVLKADGTALTNIVQISAGYNFALALASDGTVWAWGDNLSGQLGRGTVGAGSGAAVQVQGLSGGTLGSIVMVAAGGRHALALDTTGRVLAWGYAVDGELGDGAARPVVNQTALPRVVVNESGSIAGFTDIVSVAAGYADSYALGRDGRVLSWGSNFHGALGRSPSLTSDNTPTRVTTPTGQLTLAMGYPNLTRHGR